MDAKRFDHLVKAVSAAGTRRGIVRVLASLPLAGWLGFHVSTEASSAKRRDKNRDNSHGKDRGKDRDNGRGQAGADNHKHRGRRRKHNLRHKNKHKKKCKPQSTAQTCDGQCGPVKNNCKKTVDCGSCACDPACEACQVCNAASVECAADPAQVGDPCGEPGEVCQADGSCAEPCGDVCAVGCPFDSIQEAIDAASDGDIITICAGTFVGPLTLDKNLTLVGAGTEETILDGDALNSVIAIDPSLTEVEIRDLTLTNGNSSGVGGGVSNGNALTTLRNVLITANVAAERGGGIDINIEGQVTLIDSQVTENEAGEHGGGIFSFGLLTLEGSTVSGNSAPQGGGIYNDGPALDLTDSTISGNFATNSNGGGIVNNSNMTLTNTDVTNNDATGRGGGIFCGSAGTEIDANSSVTGNHADIDGGGIFNEDGEIACAAEVVTSNTAGDPMPAANNCIDAGIGTGCGDCS